MIEFLIFVLMRSALVISVVVCAASTAAFAHSQVISVPPCQPPLFMLKSLSVQKELKLSESQVQKILSLIPQNVERGTDLEPTYVKARALMSKAQAEKLEQMHRKEQGVYSLTYSRYGKVLGITNEQAEKLKSAYSSALGRVLSDKQKEPNTGEEVKTIRLTLEDQRKARQQVEADAKGILTPKQLSLWKDSIEKTVKV